MLRTPDSVTVFLPAGGFSLPFLAGSDHWGDGCRDRFCQTRLPSPVSSILRGYSQCNKSGEASECLGSSFKRSEEHTSELQSRGHLVCRLLLEKKKIVLRLQ